MNMSGLGGEKEVIHQGPKGEENELFRDTDGERGMSHGNSFLSVIKSL